MSFAGAQRGTRGVAGAAEQGQHAQAYIQAGRAGRARVRVLCGAGRRTKSLSDAGFMRLPKIVIQALRTFGCCCTPPPIDHEEAPPGGACRRVELRSLMKLLRFWRSVIL